MWQFLSLADRLIYVSTRRTPMPFKPKAVSKTAIIVLGIASLGCALTASTAPRKPPNVLIILADDLAYSDIAPFGGEISTPNMARLAKLGVTFTYFHTSPMCSPSRAMLLTGAAQHRTGFGAMAEFQGANQKGKPGYEGHLNDRVVTLAERFQAAGYRTAMSGKWHLGAQSLPHKRGFQDSFILVEGAGSHFNDTGYGTFKPKVTYLRDGVAAKLPDNFYSSDYYASETIRQIGSGMEKPFFAYLSFTAPHWPLHAPPDYVAKYDGRYAMGWDKLREQRFLALKRNGVISPEAKLPQRMAEVPAWESLGPEEQAYQAKLMAVYAAMVDRLDWNIGRVLDHLEETGQLDNTIIVFSSDNGPEALDFTSNSKLDGATDWIAANFKNNVTTLGKAESYAFYGRGWAHAGAAAHRYYKTYVTQGGLHTPLIMTLPGMIKGGGKSRVFATMLDLTPTLLDATGITAQSQRQFSAREPLVGQSMLPYLTGKADAVYTGLDGQGFELFANEAYIAGDWKIMKLRPSEGDGQWKLFNLARDPGELRDLSSTNPKRFEAMRKRYAQFAERTGVILRTEPFELFLGPENPGHHH
jgi:arylsulfatase A-like enzyme